ncbi:uncharacterized protein Triagg1_3672 [Trichoderma aggressivum f. europaeum]|uniref:Uncharacterized protein n=1 Tax=Trichoderma aggressivum f. europaeum TaxID=173218 RepID=A0AAE1M026_9HYPO|nr:hypothetical protein Triagg1_3672 [Trichoderma aggressivum f. europaeum]
MAGRTNRPVWETSDVDRKPVSLFRSDQTRRSPNGTDAFLPSGAVEHRPDPGPSRPPNGYSTMSGNGSNSTSGTITGNGRYNGRATSLLSDHEIAAAFRFTHGYDYEDHRGTPLPPLSTLALMDPNLGKYLAYSPYRVSPPSPSRGHRLQSPFAPVYPPPMATVAPPELVAGERPTVSPPRTSGNATTDCRCLTCSGGTTAKCFQCRLARQYELLNTAWEDERARSEQARHRMESILREEARITVDYYREVWDAEKTQLKADVAYLSEQVRTLGDENLVLRGRLADQVQAGEPIIYQGSFQGNTPLVDGSPPSPSIPSPLSPILGSPLSPPPPVARRQSSGAGSSDGARDNRRVSGLPGCYSHLFGFVLPASPQMPTHRNPSPLGRSVSPPPVSAPSTIPSTRISMSPQPGHETIPISPTFSPFLPSSPYPGAGAASGGVSTPVRSPKRPLSVIDVHELDPKLEGISLRASTVRKTTFEEAPPDGSPPSKRRRSLSHDYYIVTNVHGEDEVKDAKKTEYEEYREDAERRLTMYAGYTPSCYSPSSPSETVLLRGQGSVTPTASSSFLAERHDSPETEDRSVTATATEEVGESSGASYPDLSNHLRRADSSGALSAASGDAPLKGPLMIKNIPAQDELFLAALNERLEPISQGQDALPRAVQTPVAVPASLSAVHGEPFDGADASQTTAPDNTDISGTQSETDEEHDGVHVEMDRPIPSTWPVPNNDGQKRDVHDPPKRPAYRIKWAEEPGYAYDGTSIKAEPSDYPFSYEYDDEDLPAQVEASPTIPVKTEDSDDESDGRNSEPEVAIKFKSTSNFGAPFGRR